MFVKTKHGADRMARNLRRDGVQSDALHGDLRQNKRDRVMQNFRKQTFRVLIATDIAARGLDVPHIEHVVNYDLPQVAEDFIHRMGRTARAGAEGSAISFVSDQDSRKWHAIERLLNPDAANDRGHQNKRRPQNGKKGKPSRHKSSRGNKPHNGKAQNGKSQDGKPHNGKPHNGKPQSDQPRNGKPQNNKQGNKKRFHRNKKKAA